VVIVQAYRFALDPSPGQERALRSHAGAARFAWNWALAACLERYGRNAGGIPARSCTGGGTR
jgi:putative transposase